MREPTKKIPTKPVLVAENWDNSNQKMTKEAGERVFLCMGAKSDFSNLRVDNYKKKIEDPSIGGEITYVLT